MQLVLPLFSSILCSLDCLQLFVFDIRSVIVQIWNSAEVSQMSSRLTSESRIYADKARDLNRQVSAMEILRYDHILGWKMYILLLSSQKMYTFYFLLVGMQNGDVEGFKGTPKLRIWFLLSNVHTNAYSVWCHCRRLWGSICPVYCGWEFSTVKRNIWRPVVKI